MTESEVVVSGVGVGCCGGGSPVVGMVVVATEEE